MWGSSNQTIDKCQTLYDTALFDKHTKGSGQDEVQSLVIDLIACWCSNNEIKLIAKIICYKFIFLLRLSQDESG